MVNFHAIAEPMSIVKSLYATRDWYISGDKKEITSWLKKCLNKFWDKFINDSMTAMEYGFFDGIKDFYLGEDGKWWIKSIKPLKPHYTTLLEDDNGNFAGVQQDFREGLEKEKNFKIYEAKDCFHFAYNQKFDDPYGISRLVSARYPYITYKYIIEMTNIFYENYISPAKKGFAPQGKGDNIEGVKEFNVKILSDKLKEMELGGAKDITLPSETDEKGNRRWDVELLESSRTGADYMDYLKFLETKMSHGVLVPELAFSQTGSGSYNLFDGQEAFLAYKSDTDMAQFAAAVNEQIIDFLVDLNFGSEYVGEYKLEFTKASRKDKNLASQIIQGLTQNNKIDFDYEQLSRMTGLKITKNIIETAQAIENIKNGEATKKQIVVEKNKEKPMQLELPLNEIVEFGGAGSGNFNHSGRPGEVGGSGDGGGGKNDNENSRGFLKMYTGDNKSTVLEKTFSRTVEADEEESYILKNNGIEKVSTHLDTAIEKGLIDKSKYDSVEEGATEANILLVRDGYTCATAYGHSVGIRGGSEKDINDMALLLGAEQMEMSLSCSYKAHFEKSKRPLTPAEQKVNFAKLEDVYNNAEVIESKMAKILREIQSKIITKAKKPFLSGDILKMKNFALDDKSIFIDDFTNEMLDTYKKSFNNVVEELKLNKSLTSANLEMTTLKIEEMASKQLSDISYAVKNILMAGVINSTDFNTVEKQINDYFDDFVNNKMPIGVEISIAEMVDDGRRAGADDPNVELAQWSAIMDNSVCDLCATLDMRVVAVNSPEYNEYTPGNLHKGCRCVWIYILKGESNKPPIDWQTPPQDLQEKYMRR